MGPSGTAAILSNGAIIRWEVDGGATITMQLTATRGGARRSLGAGRFLGVERLPWVVIARQYNEPVEDHFLTADVVSVNVDTGLERTEFSFEPDYDANLALWRANALTSPGDFEVNAGVRYCDGFLFVPVGSKVYRYAYRDPGYQHPLVMSATGKLLDAPTASSIIVQRSDGDWLLTAQPHRIVARRIVLRR
jgi:hypothetical protein